MFLISLGSTWCRKKVFGIVLFCICKDVQIKSLELVCDLPIDAKYVFANNLGSHNTYMFVCYFEFYFYIFSCIFACLIILPHRTTFILSILKFTFVIIFLRYIDGFFNTLQYCLQWYFTFTFLLGLSMSSQFTLASSFVNLLIFKS